MLPASHADLHQILYPDAPPFTLEEQIADLQATIREIEDDLDWYADLNCMTPAMAELELDRLYCRVEALQDQLDGFRHIEREFAIAA